MKALTQEDLEKLKHWAEKQRICKSPHCGERCIVELERKEKGNATGNNDNPRHTREITA